MQLATHADAHPDKPAVVMASSGEVVTFRQLDERSMQLAQYLHHVGVRPGDTIAFCLENNERFHEVCWAGQRSGIYYTAISSRLTAGEIEYIVEDSGAKVLITSRALADTLGPLAGKMPSVDAYLMMNGTVDGWDSYEESVGAMPAKPLDEELEGEDLLYSSGTTGRPKGVKPPFRNAPYGTPPAVNMLCQLLYALDENSIYLSPAPLYHAAPLRFTREAQRLGATVIVMEKFDAGEYLRLVEEHHVTHSQVVPSMFVRMLKLPEEERTKHDVSSLQVVIHAAAPCPVPVKQAMIEWWGPVIHEYYAGTEGNGFVAINSEEWLAHKGSVGKPLLSNVHICDEATGEELPPREQGVVYFEPADPDTPIFEYHGDEEKTKRSRHPDNPRWTTLGDVGYVDEDGYLYLTDRKDFMIVSGGVNIYPQESENVLVTHPKVMDAAVFGVPNDDFGEEVKAVIQPVDMSEAGPELERELIAFCQEHLAKVKCPRSVDFMEELPRHPTGKLYKRLLRDQYWEGRESKIV
ncbi:MAG TPA: AMP-binding protein [Acidimicrobiia bacterium]|nr:AMP-binding protein [Acidimicrobiia bacterium]